MKVCCIIAEFNPFHNGHKHLIDETKKKLNYDYLIVIMSGNFVQRGECAIFDKYMRAKIAIQNGVDLVIELPPYYAINNASNFAKYSCKMINMIPKINYLSFGCEIDDIILIKNLSEISLNYKNKSSDSYIKSRSEFFSNSLNISAESFNKSNLILAIEYIKYLDKTIIPLPIKRVGADYNDTTTTHYASASAIRNFIKKNNYFNIDELNINYLIEDAHFMEKYFEIIIHTYALNEVKNNLDRRIKKSIIHSTNYNELIENTYAKNISRSTIKRQILRNLLKLDSINIDDIYFNILAFNESGKKLLKYIPTPIIRNSDIMKLDKNLYNLYKLHQNIDFLYEKIKG